MKDKDIYTHDEAAQIVEVFENLLDEYGIRVPSPEDDERDPDNGACLYGSVYSDLLDGIEDRLIDFAERVSNGGVIVPGIFSGWF